MERAKKENLEIKQVMLYLAEEIGAPFHTIRQRYYRMKNGDIPRPWEYDYVEEIPKLEQLSIIEVIQPKTSVEEVEEAEYTTGEETNDTNVSEESTQLEVIPQQNVSLLREETDNILEKVALIVAERDFYKEEYEKLLLERKRMATLLGL